MSDQPPRHRFPAERVERLAVLVPAIAMCIGLVYWAVNSANTAANTAAALAIFNAQVMSRFDHIDDKIADLPALTQQVKDLRDSLVNARGDYASLDVRLRAIEQNTAAVHNEATEALKRTR